MPLPQSVVDVLNTARTWRPPQRREMPTPPPQRRLSFMGRRRSSSGNTESDLRSAALRNAASAHSGDSIGGSSPSRFLSVASAEGSRRRWSMGAAPSVDVTTDPEAASTPAVAIVADAPAKPANVRRDSQLVEDSSRRE